LGPLFEGRALGPVSNDGQRQIVAAGGQDGSGFDGELYSFGPGEPGDYDSPAPTPSPGTTPTVDRHRVNLRRADEPTGQILDPIADLARDRSHDGRALEEWPGE
jgi:hypothetical protein